jgi:hypothetical protein
MTAQNNLIEVGNFKLKVSLLEQVVEHMETALERTVKNDEVFKFLSDNQNILASIVGYDEVDTTDRHKIWDAIDDETSIKENIKHTMITSTTRSGKSIFDEWWLENIEPDNQSET